MNNNKISQKLNIIVGGIFSSVFALLFLLIVVFGYNSGGGIFTYNFNVVDHIMVILTFLLITGLFGAVFYLRWHYKAHRLIKTKFYVEHNTQLIFLGVLAILAVQIFCAVQLRIIPENDPEHIARYANVFARKGNFDCLTSAYRGHYAVKYPNNLGAIFLYSFLFRIEYLFTGSTSWLLPRILNVIAVNSTILMSVLLSRRIYGKRRALAVLIMCAAFTPFYTYVAYCYTDTLSMPFLIGAMYLFKIAQDTKSRAPRYILTGVSGVVLCLGTILKGSVILIVVAMSIYIILAFGFKRAICTVLALVMGFGMIFGGFKAATKALIPAEMSDKYEYPYTHWVMMGLTRRGSFSVPDSQFTARQPSKAEKTKANLKIIGKRIKKKGFLGLTTHLSNKAIWTWQDGTYYVSHPIDNYEERSFLHDIVLIGGSGNSIFTYYSDGFQLFLILMMTASGLRLLRKRKADYMLVIRLAALGIFAFLLMWETRPRYLLNFTPMFILLAVDGMSEISYLMSKKMNLK